MIKKAILALSVLAVTVIGASTAFAQGQIAATSFNQASSSLGLIFDTDGTTPLNGTGFSVELLGGPSSDPGTFTLIRPSTSVFLSAGRTLDIGSSTLGFSGNLFYQIRAWNNNGGTVTSFDSATIRGASSVTSVTLTTAPALPAAAENFANFSLAVVPEPSTIALGLIGATALLLRRRRS